MQKQEVHAQNSKIERAAQLGEKARDAFFNVSVGDAPQRRKNEESGQALAQGHRPSRIKGIGWNQALQQHRHQHDEKAHEAWPGVEGQALLMHQAAVFRKAHEDANDHEDPEENRRVIEHQADKKRQDDGG